jgi:predicted nucleic acid-binding protein
VIILDTNVTSELMRAQPDPAVIAWLADQSPTDLFSTAVTVAEISYGLERLPRGRRRKSLEQAYQSVSVGMADDILPFDVDAALLYGSLMARMEQAGTPIDPMDAEIACIAASRGATVATRNECDFADCGVRLVNPWRHME